MKRYWMPFYVGDYLADTGHLSAEEHGAYLLLIFHYWMRGGVPQTQLSRSRAAQVSLKKWKAIEPTIASFFDENWRHARIEQELAKVEDISRKRSIAARRSNIRVVRK